MDFPDVSLVCQVSLPSDADAYTHRVGRTARAGKDGRAVILLTDAESFYLKVNPQFPIHPHPASAKILALIDSTSLPITTALRSAPPDSKQKAYAAYLGFMKTFANKLKLNPAGLVQMANEFALKGMLCTELPKLEKKTVGKMGLKGVPGISFASPTSSKDVSSPALNHGRPQPNPAHQRGQGRQSAPQGRNNNKRPASSLAHRDKEPSRRLRHQ